MIAHPFEQWPNHHRLGWGLATLFLTLIAGKALLAIPGDLSTDGAPYGILSLELAGTATQADAIISAWDSDARDRAQLNVFLDYPFIVAYTLLLTAMVVGVIGMHRRAGHVRTTSLARAFAWGVLLAGIFDLLENLGLLYMLRSEPAGIVPRGTWLLACGKFLLLAASLLFVLVAGVIPALWRHCWKDVDGSP